jgi:hypothetical protein
MLKDVRLCLEEGQAPGVPFPAAAHTREVLDGGDGTRGLGTRISPRWSKCSRRSAGIRL